MALLFVPSIGAASMQVTIPPPFSTLEAAHGYSVPGPIAVSPNGNTAFVAEAGVMKVIDTAIATSWTDLSKINPISSHHVRAVELALDPEAQFDQPDTPEDTFCTSPEDASACG